MAATLDRTTFETNRAAEYFRARELQAQTGQPIDRFAAVALKELTDNALDACEAAGVPPAIDLAIDRRNGHTILTVGDNGRGLPPDTVRRILNFNTRTSDKSVYRAPTRGAQGNALKTVLGMPCALDVAEPVIIDAQGLRHTIRAWVDPAGELRIDHAETPAPAAEGTRITLELPTEGQNLTPSFWARAFALFNPHATVRICIAEPESKPANPGPAETENLYRSTVEYPGGWRKFLPTDLTSPWWYDADTLGRLVFSHIAETRRGGRDLTLRDFVRQFRGLSGTAKAKAVCDQFPTLGRLSDFEAEPGAVAGLLAAMQAATEPPSPGVLGLVGEDHYRACFSAWYGVKRFWYRKVTGMLGNIPFVFEAALAETERGRGFYTGLNYSPSYEDPLAGTRLGVEKVTAWGVRGFLAAAHVSPIDLSYDDWGDYAHTAAAVHLVCPALEFLDRGKTRLRVPGELAEAVAGALWRVAKDLYTEEERRRKDAARQEKRRKSARRAATYNLKEAVFEVLPEALALATGDGELPVSARDLYYPVRRLVQEYTDKELNFDYFSQNLLTEYRQTVGPLEGLYYDPRGVLYEPHTGKTLPLGTRGVDSYDFPAWLYDKILYVEKKGRWPTLQAAKLAERYDMAVIAAEGYATEAARALFERADKGRQYRLFVLHDADPYGYNIARTLRAETRRMPGYSVDVIDLGLDLAEALEMGLEAETFTRKNALPQGLELTNLEKRYFVGNQVGRRAWICRRIELNALTAPALVAYIERKLAEAGATGKVIPPGDVLPDLAAGAARAQVGTWVSAEVARLLNTDEISRGLADRFLDGLDLDEAQGWIETAFEASPALSWRAAMERKLTSLIRDGLQEELRAEIAGRLATWGQDGQTQETAADDWLF